jgi:hypothetical protein
MVSVIAAVYWPSSSSPSSPITVVDEVLVPIAVIDVIAVTTDDSSLYVVIGDKTVSYV